MNLPIEFQNKMKHILGDEYEAFINSYDEPNVKAAHINTAIISNDEFCHTFNNTFIPIEDVNNGYYYNLDKIGLNPLSHAGLIYSQDPGALRTISMLPDIFTPGSIVLDLCAAPGGKSSQISCLLHNINGFLVSNEISHERNKILQSNMERMGYDNNLITCLSPDEIASILPSAFTHIIIDAPCSGEGMFRKYPDSISEWSLENVNMCAQRQRTIIDSIMPALKKGGYLVYSTCTFSPEENEEIIEYILNHYNFKIITKGTHIYPHQIKGEGQFYCLLKEDSDNINYTQNFFEPDFTPLTRSELKIVTEAFPYMTLPDNVKFYMNNGSVIACGNIPLRINRKNIEKLGAIVGTIRKDRLVPHHNFFKVYGKYINNNINLEDNPRLLDSYLMGNEITVDSSLVKNGYGTIGYYHATVGGFKASGGRLKNYYPKGLRNNTSYL